MVEVFDAQGYRSNGLFYWVCFLRRSEFDMDPKSFATGEEKRVGRLQEVYGRRIVEPSDKRL